MDNKKAIDLLSMIEFEHAECCLNTWFKGIDDDMKEALDMAIKALEQEPKIGRWEEVQFRTIPYNRISKAKKCSVCGKRKDKYVTWNYCPNCGAKMGVKANDRAD